MLNKCHHFYCSNFIHMFVYLCSSISMVKVTNIYKLSDNKTIVKIMCIRMAISCCKEIQARSLFVVSGY